MENAGVCPKHPPATLTVPWQRFWRVAFEAFEGDPPKATLQNWHTVTAAEQEAQAEQVCLGGCGLEADAMMQRLWNGGGGGGCWRQLSV